MGETMETVTVFIFLGSKITAGGDCSHEIKRHFLLGRKAMTNLDSTLKSRDFTLLTEVCLVKAMVFPVVMYGCETWTIKKAERWRIWNVVAEPWKTPRFLASRGGEFNLGPVTRLDRSKLMCKKVLLKYKRDRESFWYIHQMGAERLPPC